MNNYTLDEYGILHQIKVEPFEKDYGAERNNYGEISHYLSYLRLGFILGHIDEYWLRSLLDVGFGNGDFLRAAQSVFPVCAGHDLNFLYLPSNCKIESSLSNLPHYDVITMFDSYEHFPSLDFIKNLSCEFLVISVPNCKYPENDQWLSEWKHLRPNEHLHHFNTDSITEWLIACDYNIIDWSFIEDAIRKNPKESDNILTVIARKNK